MDWAVEFIRWIIWGIGGLVLSICDALFEVMMTIAGLNLINAGDVFGWWLVLTTLIGGFVMIRVISLYVNQTFSDEDFNQINYGTVLFRLIPLALVIALIPMALGWAGWASRTAINEISIVTGGNANQKMSELIINASSYKGDISERLYDTGTVEVVYSLKDLNAEINKRIDGDFVYLPTFSSLFLAIFSGVAASLFTIRIALTFLQRLYSIVLKILISPLPISAIVIPHSTAFSKWSRSIMGDYITNYFQVLFLYVVLIISNSAFIIEKGPLIQIFVLLAGLMANLIGIPAIAEFIGGDIGTGSTVQGLRQIKQDSSVLGHAAAFGAGVGTTAAAMGGHALLKGSDKMMQSFGGTGLATGSAWQRAMGKDDTKSGYSGSSKVGRVLSGLDNAMVNRISQSKPYQTGANLKQKMNSFMNETSRVSEMNPGANYFQGNSSSASSLEPFESRTESMNNYNEPHYQTVDNSLNYSDQFGNLSQNEVQPFQNIPELTQTKHYPDDSLNRVKNDVSSMFNYVPLDKS